MKNVSDFLYADDWSKFYSIVLVDKIAIIVYYCAQK